MPSYNYVSITARLSSVPLEETITSNVVLARTFRHIECLNFSKFYS
jgi:hypothetical protein